MCDCVCVCVCVCMCVCVSVLAPLLSFLEADSDLSKPYEFNTLKAPGGPPTGKGTLRPPQVTGGGGGGGGKKPSKAAFTDAELKILR